MNVVCMVGRMTADPELKKTPNGVNVCSFSVAVQSNNKNEDGSYKTDFINCVAWRGTAEFITKYFKKGQNIGLNGSIQTRTYQDKDTGKNRTAFEVLINNAYFVESKSGTSTTAKPTLEIAPQAEQPQQLYGFQPVASDDGDLPF